PKATSPVPRTSLRMCRGGTIRLWRRYGIASRRSTTVPSVGIPPAPWAGSLVKVRRFIIEPPRRIRVRSVRGPAEVCVPVLVRIPAGAPRGARPQALAVSSPATRLDLTRADDQDFADPHGVRHLRDLRGAPRPRPRGQRGQ